MLPRVLFPVGHLLKPQVRELASQFGLPTARKKDSTGICFIGEKRFHEFLERYLPAKPGDIVTTDGKVIGKHDGLMFATIGQRKGLHIGGQKEGSGEAWYVVAKDVARNQLIIAQGHDSAELYFKAVSLIKPTFLHGLPQLPLSCTCKVRYRAPDASCILCEKDGNLMAIFDRPVLAAAAGQSAVFYQGDECLGGAIIDKTFRSID